MTATVAFLIGLLTMAVALWILRRLTDFWAQTDADYAGGVPALDLRRHLSGRLTCDGMIFGPTGRVTSRFRMAMRVAWTGQRGSITEEFGFDDGTVQHRQWNVTLEEDGRVRIEADDVIGEGGGRVSGHALGMRYRLRLPPENGGHVLDATDWLYLQEDGTILNRSQFRAFGIPVAELFATIRPVEDREV